MLDTIATLALCALSVAAVLWDLKTRRIPNVLTASGLLIALLLRAVQGPAPLAAGVLAAGIGLGLSLPLVVAGALGGGDMKLLAASAAFVGLEALPTLLLVTAIMGGVLAIVVAARRRALAETMIHARALVAGSSTRSVARRTLATPGALAVPYGVAIAAGALAGWWA
jgi:prepilin peptidase CpaA